MNTTPGMTGRSKTPPRGTVRPLGTPRPKKTLDSVPSVEVNSLQPLIPAVIRVELPMNLVFKSLSQNGKRAIYEAGPTTVHFTLNAFPGQPPASIGIEDVFAAPKVKVDKVAETKEERKARMAALPKLTLAERAQKARERADALTTKAAAAAVSL